MKSKTSSISLGVVVIFYDSYNFENTPWIRHASFFNNYKSIKTMNVITSMFIYFDFYTWHSYGFQFDKVNNKKKKKYL